MKKYNKFIALFMIISLIFAPLFTSCDKGGDGAGDETTTTEEVAEEPIVHKVGFIYDGTVANSAYNLIWEDARAQLERNFGVETGYVENVFVSNFEDAVRLLSERNFTVVVSTSDAFKPIIVKTAELFKKIKFISFGGEKLSANLTTFEPLIYQPANICGMAASYNTNSEVFGIVSDPVIFNHEGVINAYIRGVKDFVERGGDFHVNYVNSFIEADVKKAVDDLVEKGIDVIMLYLYTDYAIKYCESLGVKVVAFSGNLPDLAPQNYITGFYFNVTSYISEQVMYIINDMFFPEHFVGDLGSGHARMINLNTDENVVSPGTKMFTDALYKRMLTNDQVFKGQIFDNFMNIQVEHGYTLNYREVLEMKWMEFSVGGNIKGFSDAVTEIPYSELIVRGEWKDGVRPDHVPNPEDIDYSITTSTSAVSNGVLEPNSSVIPTDSGVTTEVTTDADSAA